MKKRYELEELKMMLIDVQSEIERLTFKIEMARNQRAVGQMEPRLRGYKADAVKIEKMIAELQPEVAT